MAVFTAWRTADLIRARRLPPLARLLRKRKRLSRAERAEVLQAVAEAEAYFAALEAQAREAAGGR